MQKLISAGTVRRDRSQWYISQCGDAAQFENWFACGPTSLLMALADFGLAFSDEGTCWALIEATKTMPGYGFPGDLELMEEYARKYGLEAKFKYTHDLQEIDHELELGRGIILYGAMRVPYGNYVGHFVYVAEKCNQSGYIVGDPAYPNASIWTDQELHNYISTGSKPAGFVSVYRGSQHEWDD